MERRAWEIALVTDPALDIDQLEMLIGQMPICAVSSPGMERAAEEIRSGWGRVWEPEPCFSLFPAIGEDPDANCLAVIDSVRLKHPIVSALQLIGVTGSEALWVALRNLGYRPAVGGALLPGLRVRKPLETIPGVRDLVLDAGAWRREKHVWDGFFHAVGAPSWHGRNFNALRDSILTGDINQIEVPYRLIIRNYDRIGARARGFAKEFVELIRNFEAQGCPITVQFGD